MKYWPAAVRSNAGIVSGCPAGWLLAVASTVVPLGARTSTPRSFDTRELKGGVGRSQAPVVEFWGPWW